MPTLINDGTPEGSYRQLLFDVAQPAATLVSDLLQEILDKIPSEKELRKPYALCLAIKDRLEEAEGFLTRLVDESDIVPSAAREATGPADNPGGPVDQ